MQFRASAEIFTADNHEVGKIDRVVINPRTKDVTHVIVRKGQLFTEDKSVPIEQIAEASSEWIWHRPSDDFRGF